MGNEVGNKTAIDVVSSTAPDLSSTPPTLFQTFKRSQVASVVATVVDFGSLVFLVEVGRVWYVGATAIGAFLGAVTNFSLGRWWVYRGGFNPVLSSGHKQAVKYALVSGGSLLLNSGGVYLLTDLLGFQYAVSKAIVSLLVGVFFNFPMQRSFVFR